MWIQPRGTPSDSTLNAGALVRSMILAQSLSTDDQGRFRISGLSPGRYTVAVQEASTFTTSEDSDGDAFLGALGGLGTNPHSLRFYSGDTVHRTEAKVYELRGGEETGSIEITIPADAFHSITGVVTTADGRPVNTGSVRLEDAADEAMSLTAKIDQEGSYAFREVPNGTYKLTVGGAGIQQLVAPSGQARTQGMVTISFDDTVRTVVVKENDVTLPLTTGKQTETPAPTISAPH